MIINFILEISKKKFFQTKMTWKKRLLMIPRQMPPSYRGEWRTTMILTAKINGKIQKQCLRIRYDIYEYSN